MCGAGQSRGLGFRARLSDYLRQAKNGARFTIVSRSEPVAEISAPTQPPPENPPRRKLGTMKGEVWMAEDWDTWPDDVLESFEAPLEPGE